MASLTWEGVTSSTTRPPCSARSWRRRWNWPSARWPSARAP